MDVNPKLSGIVENKDHEMTKEDVKDLAVAIKEYMAGKTTPLGKV
jgi:hypothetical protein